MNPEQNYLVSILLTFLSNSHLNMDDWRWQFRRFILFFFRTIQFLLKWEQFLK